MPQRLQRKRTPGSHLPPGTVCVDRTTPWGNPWTAEAALTLGFASTADEARKLCAELHRAWLLGEEPHTGLWELDHADAARIWRASARSARAMRTTTLS
jgi:hypothetical protein